jgi:hypothetical protein
MIESPEQNSFWSIIETTVLALPGIILEPFLLKEMLCAPEVCAKIQDEGLESGRIQQVG